MNKRSLYLKSKLRPFTGMPDLVPFIGVIFLLLIFFMISSSFVQVSGIKVELPEIGTNEAVGIEKFVVTVAGSRGADGYEISFNEQVVSWETLQQELAKVSNFSNAGTVILRADKNTPFGVVARIMALAEKANLAVFIAAVPPQKKEDTRFEQND